MIVVWIIQAAGSYDQIVWFCDLFDIAWYATTYGIPFWALMVFLFVWFLPVFNVTTGFNGPGGSGFGLLLLYAAIGGGDMAMSFVYRPVFSSWKQIVLDLKAEEERDALTADLLDE